MGRISLSFQLLRWARGNKASLPSAYLDLSRRKESNPSTEVSALNDGSRPANTRHNSASASLPACAGGGTSGPHTAYSHATLFSVGQSAAPQSLVSRR